jgi:RNA polymerase sigma-70 factor (ECF subfamily)
MSPESALLAYVFGPSSSDDGPHGVWRGKSHPPGMSATNRADTDDTLVTRIRRGDTDAFDTIYMTYAPMLWRFATRLTRSSTDAEELVHDVFAAVWEHRARWHLQHTVKTYLFGAIRNRIIDRRRRMSTATAALTHDVDEASNDLSDHATMSPAMGRAPALPDVAVESLELAEAIRMAIATLPERRRTAFTLRHLDDMSYADIGAILGVSEKAAFILVARTRTTLRPLFERFVENKPAS